MIWRTKRLLSTASLLAVTISLAACGGGGGGSKPSYTIGGNLTGLGSGLTVTLLNNGGDALTRGADGSFVFATPVKKGKPYVVTVGTQPTGQSCTVGNGSGVVGSANVTNVTVTCASLYSVGGSVSGLAAGQSVTLLNNGGNALTRSADGAFTFTTLIASGASYAVTVGTQPTGQTCSVGNGTGTIAAANVTNVTVTCATTGYTVGGTISGLGGGVSVTLLNNGADALTRNANGSFTFATPMASGAAYAVTVGTQPTGQTCSVSHGTGTLGAANVTNVAVTCTVANQFAWQGGSNLVAPMGVYGTKGVPAASNVPGGRNWSGSWKDASGNFWVFGGMGYDSVHTSGDLNDLWQYNPTTRVWTWMSGSTAINGTGVYGTMGVPSAANVPGARESMISWTDSAGNLWLFGGRIYQGFGSGDYLNDLWKYSPGTGQWTWVGGPSTLNSGGVYGSRGVEAAGNWPGARYGAIAWTDSAGTVWMFGGYGLDSGGVLLGYLNDLWRYNPTNGRWTWVGGSSTYGATGVYGTKGTAAAANVPGSRAWTAAAWTDSAGNLWMFGGMAANAANTAVVPFNDLWKYNPSSDQWTWMSGSNVDSAKGVYGTKGTAAAANVPGARGGSVSWADASGNLWLFGGAGYDAVGTEYNDLNDLWKYSVASGQWTWVNGSNTVKAAGVYGTLGTPSASTQPGARDSGCAWIDGSGHVWLFGGAGYDSAGVYDAFGLNDLFEYFP